MIPKPPENVRGRNGRKSSTMLSDVVDNQDKLDPESFNVIQHQRCQT